MKNSRISKRNIKSYIKYYEQKLTEKEAETAQLQKENDESKYVLYDLTEQYLAEERIRGMLDAAKFILYNC